MFVQGSAGDASVGLRNTLAGKVGNMNNSADDEIVIRGDD